MNVRELIQKLQKFPLDMPVLVDGYEGGLTDAFPPKRKKVIFNYREPGYEGPHEELEWLGGEYKKSASEFDIRTAVIIKGSDL